MPSEDYDLEATPHASGSQGHVYFGTRRADGLPVAVKVAPAGTGLANALLREMELLRALAEAGITGTVVCLEGIRVGEQLAMVMPRYERTLSSWLSEVIQRPTPTTLEDVLTRIAELARILSDVHSLDYEGNTVIHRDIKPENVFLDNAGRPHIGDFGGAMAIGGLARVQLALFGTPMWAPLDQILPADTIPDPTWDTYALCVLLYAAVTGARPAYQADPTELLTPKGREVWQAARNAVEAKGEEREGWHRRFADLRKQCSSSDIVDFTGRAALLQSDRAALENGLRSLCVLAQVTSEQQIARLERGLWKVLVRGLSPLSHPSPPNRFRDARELADDLEELRELLLFGALSFPTPASIGPQDLPGPIATPVSIGDHIRTVTAEAEHPPTTLTSSGPPFLWIGLGLFVLVVIAILLLFTRDSWMPLLDSRTVIPISGGTVTLDGDSVRVADFLLDRTEVTAAAWEDCSAAGVCAPVSSAGTMPAVGLSMAEAARYCAFREGRLPTEAEWLHAYGPDPYPWGTTEPTCDHAVALGCADSLLPVGSTRLGASAQGIQDLVGNAWEWVITAEGTGALRGGDLRSPRSELGRDARITETAIAPANAGVRCVY